MVQIKLSALFILTAAAVAPTFAAPTPDGGGQTAIQAPPSDSQTWQYPQIGQSSPSVQPMMPDQNASNSEAITEF